MENAKQPQIELAEKVLPKPLLSAIQRIFDQEIMDCALVGGTCLAGFYAGHRRSDDIDLFVKSTPALRSTILAAKSLTKHQAKFINETQSLQFYHANCIYQDYHFTIDVVLDENLFKVGHFVKVKGGIVVADLSTLLKMKSATLVSRCGEKDLYDLKWLRHEFPAIQIADLVELGRTIDGGMNPESVLASIGGTILRVEACDFSTNPRTSEKEIFEELIDFQKTLIQELSLYLRNQPTPPLGKLVKKVRKLMK